MSTVHVFPDVDAKECHIEGLGDRVGEAAKFLEFRDLKVYGMPSDQVLEMMEQATDRERP